MVAVHRAPLTDANGLPIVIAQQQRAYFDAAMRDFLKAFFAVKTQFFHDRRRVLDADW